MKPVLTQVRCSVRECGAMVLVAEVEGRRVALDPTWREVVVVDRTVDVHMKSIRKKLGKCRDYIETVRGAGYRFIEA